ncbi:MAG TPA: DUF1553 domain-containing protein [Verrucomicrobiales bacterium]|nr:DUF1553 domain-containing protein [Verrucomicrobiales bacterium]
MNHRRNPPAFVGLLPVPFLFLLSVPAVLDAAPAANPSTEEDRAFFAQEVHPLLQVHCFECHGGGERLKAGFRITSREGLLRGGDLGAAVDLASPAQSLLLRMISYADPDHEMPPAGKLPPEERAVLQRWIEQGAPYDPALEIAGDPESEEDPTKVTAQSKAFWSFQPVIKPPVPQAGDSSWSENPIDAFLYRRLEERGLRPNPPAPPEVLLRRAYYDLIGLPPTPEQVRRFRDDPSPGAFASVVDDLLASAHYGEKWGRHWLDLVRYADSNGYERDSDKAMAWGYRDYVIRAFNEDKPYDRFLREQLAGDELDDADDQSVAATGFHRLGLWDDEPADPELSRYDYLDGILSTTGEVMLGLTIGCARCHDHKIDPIPAADYYRMLSFFIDISPHGAGDANLVAVTTSAEDVARAAASQAKRAAEDALRRQLVEAEEKLSREAATQSSPAGSPLPSFSGVRELRYRFYRDTWDRLPGFDRLRPETEGPLDTSFFGLYPASRPGAMGLVFEGILHIPTTGDYHFALESHGGSRLLVDGRPVAGHPEARRALTEGSLHLESGFVPVRLDYFNRDGEPLLDLRWSGPGFDRISLTNGSTPPGMPLVGTAASRASQRWLHTTSKPSGNWTSLRYDARRRWKRDPGGFGLSGALGAVARTGWSSPEIWLRQVFEVRSAPATLVLTLHQLGETEVYLNETLVCAISEATEGYTDFTLGSEAVNLLREGANVLAIHSRRSGEGSQFIDAGLSTASGAPGHSAYFALRGPAVLGQPEVNRYFRIHDQLEESLNAPPPVETRKVMGVAEQGRRPTHILKRGNPALASEEVQPGFPSVLDPPEPVIDSRGSSSGKRRALADWIASPENPLTARVMVNRIWQHHFGRGLVRGTNDFGRQGDLPTHPELLDWLAASFVEKRWSMKAMHRAILLSRAYQMSSGPNPHAQDLDPDNTLLWRFHLRRLTAEELRDSMLAISGGLNLKLFGPAIYTKLPTEVLASSSTGMGKWGTSPPDEARRRSVYIFARRSLRDPFQTVFDAADTDSSCPVRFSTVLPTQALTLLNSSFVNEQAAALAARLRSETASPRDQIDRAFWLALSRPPTGPEIDEGLRFLESLQTENGLKADDALDRFCLLVLNLNEFLYLD